MIKRLRFVCLQEDYWSKRIVRNTRRPPEAGEISRWKIPDWSEGLSSYFWCAIHLPGASGYPHWSFVAPPNIDRFRWGLRWLATMPRDRFNWTLFLDGKFIRSSATFFSLIILSFCIREGWTIKNDDETPLRISKSKTSEVWTENEGTGHFARIKTKGCQTTQTYIYRK